MPRTKLFLDIDDTLLSQSYDTSGFDLRPGVLTQVKYLARLFDTYWATHWGHKNINSLLKLLYSDSLIKTIRYLDWRNLDPKDKAPAIVAQGGKDFYWLEDSLSTGNLKVLEEAGLSDRYIPVEAKGPWGFTYALNTLFAKASINEKDIKRVGGKIGWFYKALPDVEYKDQLEQGTLVSGFVTNGKQHCGDCVHRLKNKNGEYISYCIHPDVLRDPELVSRLTTIDNTATISINGEKNCCAYISKGKEK